MLTTIPAPVSGAESRLLTLDAFALSVLADPVTKLPATPARFPVIHGVIDARVFLPNTPGFVEWKSGQDEYEIATAAVSSSSVVQYRRQIDEVRPVYEHFQMDGAILDVGGGYGTVREFLPDTAQYFCVDPYVPVFRPERAEAWRCLNEPMNFARAMAEFLPAVSGAFDWVHMRSMLDHVQVPDICMLEVRRVLKPNGKLLVGLYVEGGKSGVVSASRRAKQIIKAGLGVVGYVRDHHLRHPTLLSLKKLITDNGFTIEGIYWQPAYNDEVCYILCRP